MVYLTWLLTLMGTRLLLSQSFLWTAAAASISFFLTPTWLIPIWKHQWWIIHCIHLLFSDIRQEKKQYKLLFCTRSLSLESQSGAAKLFPYTLFFPIWAVVPPRNFQKKSVSQSTQNALKRIEMKKKNVCLMSGISLCCRMLNIFKKKKKVCLNRLELLWNA